MPKRILPILVCLLGTIASPQARVQLPTKAQQFAMELELCQSAEAGNKPSKCKLYGKIEVVDAFPDVKIQKVSAFGDIKVKWVDAFPDDPGEWQKVSAFGDYKVQFVDAFGDYKVEFVESFPGCD